MVSIDWAAIPPSSSDPRPRYAQLAASIAEMVQTGALRPGEQLPPERELAAAVGMSRMTARQGLQQLARDGIVTIRHGSGIFVNDRLAAEGSAHAALPDVVLGTSPQSQTLEQHIVEAPPAVAAALELAAGSNVVRIVRVRSDADVPYLLHIAFLPAARFGDMAGRELGSTPLHDMLAADASVGTLHTTQTIEAGVAGAYHRRWLALPETTALLIVNGVLRDKNDTPVEAFRATFRADRVAVGCSTNGSGASTMEYRLIEG